MDQKSDSVRTNSNFLCELRQIMTRYDFLLLDEWFWAMFGSQLNLIILLGNFSCELGQIMTRYDKSSQVIYSKLYIMITIEM